MSLPIAQRTITITITRISNHRKHEQESEIEHGGKHRHHYDVTYSYWSPITGLSYVNAQQCDLKIDRPTACLFVLDFQSTLAGWTMPNTTPHGDSAALVFVPGPNNQSLQTYNPYKTTSDVYRFFINYLNTANGDHFSEDPQEGNIPR